MTAITVAQATKDFLTWKRTVGRVKGTSLECYSDDLAAFCAYHAWKPLDTVSAEDVAHFKISRREQGYSQNTRHRSELTILQFFFWAKYEAGHAVQGDILDVASTRRLYGLEGFLPFATIEEILEAPGRSTLEGVRDSAMIRLTWECALKVSQLVSMKMDQLDLKKRVLLSSGTDGKVKRVPFSKIAAKQLDAYLHGVRPEYNREDSPFIFLSNRSKPFTRQGFWLVLRKRSKDRTITVEKMRNTRAAFLYRLGYTVEQIQEILGHRDIINTRTLIRSIKKFQF